MMLERHARYVPVCEGPMLLGVVSFHDVAKAVYEEQSFENRMLKSYIKDWPAKRSSSDRARRAKPCRAFRGQVGGLPRRNNAGRRARLGKPDASSPARPRCGSIRSPA